MKVYIKGYPIPNATSYKLFEKIVAGKQSANLIEIDGESNTSYYVDYTVNADGSITTDGTAIGGASFFIVYSGDVSLPEGTYYLTGCPTGGSKSTYRLIMEYGTGNDLIKIYDTGSGASFTLSEPKNQSMTVYIRAENETPMENRLFKPMVSASRDAEFGSTVDVVTYNKLSEKTTIDFEVSAMGLETGAHTLVVKATANGYDDSDYSNEVTYTQT